MIVASVGVVLVLRYVLDELFGPPVLDRDVTQLALGVVLALIWTPMWLWHRARVQRLLVEEPAEHTSVLRKLAAYLTLGVTAALVAQASIELIAWLLGVEDFGGYPLAAVVVWGGLWLFHWEAETNEGQPTDETRTVRRLYVYATATYSLALLATGLSFILSIIFREAYDGLFDLPVFLQRDEALWDDEMRWPVAVALTGGGLWAWHWLVVARGDAGSDIRQFYLYAFAILGGVVGALSAAGVLLFGMLEWGIGTPAEDTASAHFRYVPGALAPLLVALLLWAYHWTVIHDERAAAGELPVARRIYNYTMTALGLGALAGALITLVPTVIAIVVPSAQEVIVGEDWWRDRIVLFLTLTLLGVPVWAYHWYRAERSAALRGAEERQSLPRRMLIFGVLGVGALSVLGTASYLLFVFLNAALEDELSLTLLRDAKWSIGPFAAAVLIAPYYWFVLQEDRAAAPAPAVPAAPRKSVTLLISADGQPLVERIEAALGAKVRVLQRADAGAGLPELSAEALASMEQRIAEAPGTRVLVVADASGVQVFSYR
jgi:hypothetical protein